MEKFKFDLSSWKRIKSNGHVAKSKRNMMSKIIKPKCTQMKFNNAEFDIEMTAVTSDMECSIQPEPQTENSIENSNTTLEANNFFLPDSYQNWNIEFDGDEFSEPEVKDDRRFSLTRDLAEWSAQHKIKNTAMNALLSVLNKNLPDLSLPKDSRTILKTPREKVVIAEASGGGSYWHYGLEKALVNILGQIEYCEEVMLNINVDGLPLYRSSKMEFWPILANIHKKTEISPFVIGIYCGKGKPESIDWFLSPFVNEFLEIQENGGVSVNDKKIVVNIRCFICDTPARTTLKGVIGHNGYHGCLKCVTKGSYSYSAKHVILTELTATRRTDEKFRSGAHPDHCKNITIVRKLPIDLIEDFPVAECLHLIDLGVTKRLLSGWKSGNLNNHRAHWSVRQSAEVSAFLERCKLPSEIHRKMRGLNELAHWKGTEYRSFLLYVSIVVVKKFFSSRKIFDHFLSYFCAVVICTRSDQCEQNYNIAESMFQDFLINFKVIYGIDHFSSNLHNLCHVVEDVKKFGPLGTFSAYPFESKLFAIKSLLRNGTKPLSQVAKRICEQQEARNLYKIAPKTIDKSKSFLLKNEIKKNSSNAALFSSLPLPNCTIYSEVQLPNFILRTDRYNDKWILTNSFEIICVTFIMETSEHGLNLYGTALENATNYFEYPVRSSELNIYQSDCLMKPAALFNLSDVYCKMVRIEYDNDISIFIPLFHTVKSRN